MELVRARALIRSRRAREIRENAGLSRAEAAAEIGVTEWAIQRWEAGERSPRAKAALRYARLLKALEAEATNSTGGDDDAAEHSNGHS